MLENYGIFGICKLFYFKIRTKLLFKNARLVRFPIRIRGKKFISVGDGFTTGFNCRIDAFKQGEIRGVLVKIGRGVQINDNVHIGAINKIEICDNVLIASKVFITDHNHGRYSGDIQDSPLSPPSERVLVSKPVVIKKNVWIGEFVSVLPGVTIGEGSIIGANSVVSKDIPAYSIAVGSPARVVKCYNFENNKWVPVNSSNF